MAQNTWAKVTNKKGFWHLLHFCSFRLLNSCIFLHLLVLYFPFLDPDPKANRPDIVFLEYCILYIPIFELSSKFSEQHFESRVHF